MLRHVVSRQIAGQTVWRSGIPAASLMLAVVAVLKVMNVQMAVLVGINSFSVHGFVLSGGAHKMGFGGYMMRYMFLVRVSGQKSLPIATSAGSCAHQISLGYSLSTCRRPPFLSISIQLLASYSPIQLGACK